MISSRVSLPARLGCVAGFVDTSGFLGFSGLFTAHITGNFVTIAAALISGASGAITKIVALPVFCAVVFLVCLPGRAHGKSPRTLLSVEVLLLAGAALFAVLKGPFTSDSSPAAMATGMLLVAAMAVQNAVQRLYLGRRPATTVMTANTTQLVIYVVDHLVRPGGEQNLSRIRGTMIVVASFAAGAALAALLYKASGLHCLVCAPFLALYARHAVAHPEY